MQKGLLEEVDADVRGGETVWRETGAGRGVSLAITDAGLAAIGVESKTAEKPNDAPEATAQETPTQAPQKATDAEMADAATNAAPAERAGAGAAVSFPEILDQA